MTGMHTMPYGTELIDSTSCKHPVVCASHFTFCEAQVLSWCAVQGPQPKGRAIASTWRRSAGQDVADQIWWAALEAAN